MPSIINRLKNPSHTIAGILRKVWFLFPNDKSFLKVMYRLEIGEKLNLTVPVSFNEKLQLEKVKRLMGIKIRLGDSSCWCGSDESPDSYNDNS